MEHEYPPLPVDDAVLVLTHIHNEFFNTAGEGYEQIKDSLSVPDVLAKLEGLLAACRSAGVPIIYHQESFRPGHPELRQQRGGYLRGSGRAFDLTGRNMSIRGDWGTAIPDELAPDPTRDEFVIENSRVDPFTCTEFEVLLNSLDRHVLILAGIATNFGIEMTARSASEHGYGVAILEDCIDRLLGDYSDQTIRVLLPLYGRVMMSAEAVEELTRHQEGTK